MKKQGKKPTELQETIPEVFPVTPIPVNSIVPSPANKRNFPKDNKDILELGESIKSRGLLQAIVVRKSPKKKGRFELVAGERRWRAFQLMGWEMIPSVVRELTDSEAHDITAVENIQREDLSPIEEAESIKVLLDDGREPQEIADRLGKPVSWVVRRARIADLSPKWIEAISDEKNELSKWSATHLELIARYNHAEQDEIFEEYNDGGDTATITVKELETALNNRLLMMKSAPWKLTDETLLPAAGACSTCQKRTSCQPSLFEPIEDMKVSKDDKCIDKECFGKKLIAFHEIKIKKASEEHKNLIFLVKSGGNTLPHDHPWKSSLSESWRYQGAKKSDPESVPAYILDGPGAGHIEYKKMDPDYSGLGSRPRLTGADGKPVPKSLEERREGLRKRRVIRFINKLMLLLSGKSMNQTGAKSGTCQVCGCTEDDCSGCIEKTGGPCQWIDEEKTICSACVGEIDQREKITYNLSHIEAHALCAAFGASYSNFSEFNRWKIYDTVVKMDGCSAIQASVYGVFDKIVDQLRQLTYSPEPDIEFLNNLCYALKLDREAIWTKCLEEIPEPKSWAKLEASANKTEENQE